MDKKALERTERAHRALASALIRADGAASSVARDDTGAIVDVDLSSDAPKLANRERWLRHVMCGPAAPLPAPNEHRGLKRLIRVLPRELPVVDDAHEDDTPAPEAQRVPISPPPSAPSPIRPSRR